MAIECSSIIVFEITLVILLSKGDVLHSQPMRIVLHAITTLYHRPPLVGILIVRM